MLKQKYVQNFEKSTFVEANNDLFTKHVSKTHMLNTMTSQFFERLRFSMKKHAVTIGCFGHMLNDVKSAELALVPCSKLYH